ncbi:MAG TPA: SRPBCC domain-containing protein [Polyangia bacterium]|nr:SRPBCC domain-containing protein [Polyangia bacterium]
MAHESLSLSDLIPATGEEIYSAWLDSAEHAAFTGNAASIEPVVGGRHSTFAGYAHGAIVDLQPAQRIVETWRTTDFPDDSPDSRLEVTLEPTVGGTMVTLLHTDIPEGQSDNYRDGWVKYYLEPLKSYFRRKNATVVDVEPESRAADEQTIPDAAPNGTASPMRARPKTRKAAAPAVTTAETPASKPRAKPQVTKAVVQAETNVKPAAKSKAEKPAKSVASPASTKAKPQASAAGKAKATVKAKPTATATAKPKAKPKSKVKAKTMAKAKAKAKAKPKSKAKAKAKAAPGKRTQAAAARKRR